MPCHIRAWQQSGGQKVCHPDLAPCQAHLQVREVHELAHIWVMPLADLSLPADSMVKGKQSSSSIKPAVGF